MIIKSLSRKTATFEGLIQYFHKELNPVAPTYQWNMYARTPKSTVAEFEENAGWLAKRKNGVIMYHEIISVPQNHKLPARRMGAILKDITHQYVKRRCPDQMVYGKMHMVGHPHFHLCISANAPRKSRRHRLPKTDLAQIQREVEAYTIEKYPELETVPVYANAQRKRENNRIQYTRHEKERAKRTNVPSRKEADRNTILDIFRKVKTEVELTAALGQAGFEIYVRGKTEGIVAKDGRKYRLKTLGLSSEYQTAKRRQAIYQERQLGIAHQRKSEPPNRERS